MGCRHQLCPGHAPLGNGRHDAGIRRAQQRTLAFGATAASGKPAHGIPHEASKPHYNSLPTSVALGTGAFVVRQSRAALRPKSNAGVVFSAGLSSPTVSERRDQLCVHPQLLAVTRNARLYLCPRIGGQLQSTLHPKGKCPLGAKHHTKPFVHNEHAEKA